MDTTTRGFKKPTAADPVTALRQSIRDNADKTDEFFGTDVPILGAMMTANWGSTASGLKYRKAHERVTIQGSFVRLSSPLSGGSSDPLYTMPVGARPAEEQLVTAAANASGAYYYVLCSIGGVSGANPGLLTIRTPAATSIPVGAAAYLTVTYATS